MSRPTPPTFQPGTQERQPHSQAVVAGHSPATAFASVLLLDALYLQTIEHHLRELAFSRGPLESARLGKGNKGRGYLVRYATDVLFLRADRAEDGKRSFRLLQAEPLPTSYGEDSYRRIFGPHVSRNSSGPRDTANLNGSSPASTVP